MKKLKYNKVVNIACFRTLSTHKKLNTMGFSFKGFLFLENQFQIWDVKNKNSFPFLLKESIPTLLLNKVVSVRSIHTYLTLFYLY
jgi:hypothetical protein